MEIEWSEGGGFYFDVEDEEEALSLCDLPVKLIEEGDPHFKYERSTATDDEFDFGSRKYWRAQPPPRMCLADEVFFQGQILPLRLSVSSENSSAGLLRRNGSGSESKTQEKFRSFNSSGSSSSRSHHSFATGKSRQGVPNLFHSHPSPKPQVKAQPPTGLGRSRKSSAWDILRVGVVKTPGMELQDLKHRSSTNTNSGSRNKTSGTVSGVGCKCAVETVVKMSGHGHAIREKAKKKKEKEQQEKLALSRHRTFEWLKQLSHATFPCEPYSLIHDHACF